MCLKRLSVKSFYDSNWLITVKIGIPYSTMQNEGVGEGEEVIFTYILLLIFIFHY